MLGPKYGPVSQALYVALGLLGLPVFAGGVGGIYYVLKPSFGFLLGFIAASWTAGLLSRKFLNDNGAVSVLRASAIAFAAEAVMYIVAIPCFYLNMNYITMADAGGMGLLRALQVAFVPFIITDSIKAVAAGWLAARAIPLLRKSGLL
ncbi:biotin biosynthesis protein BioY [Synergistales bacterium]|nr:biotin biosynthesis protein BioY [Synergistales bacterium]